MVVSELFNCFTNVVALCVRFDFTNRQDEIILLHFCDCCSHTAKNLQNSLTFSLSQYGQLFS